MVWLVVSGQLKELKFGTEGFTADFREAVAAPIGPSVKELLPVQTLQADEKASLAALPDIIKKKDQVLTFVLGKQYVLDVAKEYLIKLTQQPFFRFVELQQNGGALYGLVDARTLVGYLKTDDDWKNFVGAITEINMSYLTKRLAGICERLFGRYRHGHQIGCPRKDGSATHGLVTGYGSERKA